MSADDVRLTAWVVASIVLVVVLVARLQLHAFLALTMASLFMGLATPGSALETLNAFKTGFGEIAGNIGILLVLGAMLGRVLADSGATDSVAAALLRRCTPARAGWAVGAAAFVVGLPLFFETALVLLMPTICAVGLAARSAGVEHAGRKSRNAFLLIGIPVIASLSVLHGLVPPHPGPLIAIDALHADVGRTLLLGIVLGLPIAIVAGPLFAGYAARVAVAEPPMLVEPARTTRQLAPWALMLMLTSAMAPIVLIVLKTVIPLLTPGGRHFLALDYLGTPAIALLAGLLLAMLVQLLATRQKSRDLALALSDSCRSITSILLIICAGGGFKAVLIKSGVALVVAHAAAQFAVSTLVVGWLVAVVIRLATGSATVATVTASGILAPMLASHSADPSLLALSIGAGSLFLSHVNDAGFWMVKEFFGLSVVDTFKTWSLMACLISGLGLGGVLLLDALV